MQTITLREKVGADGVLHLKVPTSARESEVEVVVVFQPIEETNKNGANGAFPTKEIDGQTFRLENGRWIHNSWPVGFFERTAGSLAHDPIELSEPLLAEEREPLE